MGRIREDAAELFIDGEFRPASATSPVFEAATERLLAQGPSAREADIDDAVAASGEALHGWRSTPATERARLLERMADALEARAEHTSELCTRETGAPIAFSRNGNGLLPAAVLRYYATLIQKLDVEEVRPSASGHTIVRREPVGVVAAIVPWNVPQVLAAVKLAPALAAGCTVVLKPAPEQPWTQRYSAKPPRKLNCRRACSTSLPAVTTWAPTLSAVPVLTR